MKNIKNPNSNETLEVTKFDNEPNGTVWIQPKWLVRQQGKNEQNWRLPNNEELELINSVLYL